MVAKIWPRVSAELMFTSMRRMKKDTCSTPGLVKLPCAIGREFAGVVEEIGRDVKDFK